MKQDFNWLDAIPYLAVLISCAPLIVGGFPQGHDWTFELARVAEFSHALDEGQFPPHWAPNLYGGYGSPVFLFYASAFVALAAAASAVFGSVAGGASLAVVLFSFIGVFSIRRLFDAIPGADLQGGRIAATVFALHPYLIGDKLIRNANAEFAALCLLPFALVSAVAVGIAAAPILSQRSCRTRACVEVAIFGLCVANAWPQLASYRPLSAAQSKKIEEAVRPENLRRSALNVSVLDEYLPQAADPAVWKRAARLGGRTFLTTQPEARVEVLEEKGSQIGLRVDAPVGTRIRLARWYFSEWKAELDGVPIPVEPNPSGGIDVRLPAPGGTFKLVRQPPLSRQIGMTLSGFGVGLWLALYWVHRRRCVAARKASV